MKLFLNYDNKNFLVLKEDTSILPSEEVFTFLLNFANELPSHESVRFLSNSSNLKYKIEDVQVKLDESKFCKIKYYDKSIKYMKYEKIY